MWYTGVGGCAHGTSAKAASQGDAEGPVTDPAAKAENAAVYTRIVQYVTVGSFLEMRAGKELTALTNNDFPPKEAFTAWCKDRGVKGHKDIPYEQIKDHIKREL
jgi:hypothetical protein